MDKNLASDQDHKIHYHYFDEIEISVALRDTDPYIFLPLGRACLVD